MRSSRFQLSRRGCRSCTCIAGLPPYASDVACARGSHYARYACCVCCALSQSLRPTREHAGYHTFLLQDAACACHVLYMPCVLRMFCMMCKLRVCGPCTAPRPHRVPCRPVCPPWIGAWRHCTHPCISRSLHASKHRKSQTSICKQQIVIVSPGCNDSMYNRLDLSRNIKSLWTCGSRVYMHTSLHLSGYMYACKAIF